MDRKPEPSARPLGPYERSLKAARDAAASPSAASRLRGRWRPANSSRPGGRHRAPRKRRGRGVRITALVLVPLVLVAATAYALLRPDGDSATPVACGAERVPLTIAASPSLAPMLTEAAAAFDQGTASFVDGRCAKTTVVASEPDDFGDTLRASLEAAGGANAPTAWIPDASIWREVLSRRPELSSALARAYPVVAVSPAVIAAPRPMAEALGWPKAQPSWQQLLDLAGDPKGWGARGHSEWGKVQIAWQDPLKDAASLTAMVSLSNWATYGAETVDDVRRGLLETHSGISNLHADPEKVFAPLRDASKPADQALKAAALVPTSEQQVTAFNATSPRIPLVALYPTDGIYPNEVPLITLNAPWVTAQQEAALDRFAVFLTSGEAMRDFAAAGWRTPRLQSVAETNEGAIASEPRYVPAGPSSWNLARSLQGWTALDRTGSVLVVLDTSGSMNAKVEAAGNATRLDLAKEAIAGALPLFSDRTNIGLWTFSRHTGRTDHTVVLDLGPSSRDVGGVKAVTALLKSVADLTAEGATGLHDTTILAADEAQRNWREGDNTIILISDGKNEDPGSATVEQVLARLKKLTDQQKPVRLLTIALGAEADAATLRRFADATGGEAYVAREAEDLDKVFLAALTD